MYGLLLCLVGDGVILRVMGGVAALLGLYGCYAFALLVGKKERALAHTTNLLIASAAMGAAMSVLSAVVRGEIARGAAPSVGGLLWLLYLQYSKRVAATYRSKSAA